VFSLFDEVQDLAKPREVDSFFRFKRMLFEERNDPFVEVIEPPDSIGHAVTVIGSDYSATEEFLQCVKELNVTAVLHNCEFGEYLELAGHFWMRIDADGETTFAVNESHDPLSF
jgi:hypothetical protein